MGMQLGWGTRNT